MLKCPVCGRKLYKGKDGITYCKNCEFINDPHYEQNNNAR